MTAAVPLDDVRVVDTELFGSPGLHSAYPVDGERPVLVDAGAAPPAGVVTETLTDLGIEPPALAGIVPTHVHLDHAAAVGEPAERYPTATVHVHERGRPYLTDREALDGLVESARDAVAAAYGDPTPVPADRTVEITDGDAVDCGDRTLDVLHAPGHAPHKVALLDDRPGAVFAGDAAGMVLGGDLLPTTPAPDFDIDASLATVDRLRETDPSVLRYGHLGARAAADSALDAYADLLGEWVAAVEAAADAAGASEGNADGGTRAAVVDDLRPDWPSPTLERDVQGVLHAIDGDDRHIGSPWPTSSR